MPIVLEKPTTIDNAEKNIARERRAGLAAKLLLASVDRKPLATSKELVARRERIGAAGRLREDIRTIIDGSEWLPELFYRKYGDKDRIADNPEYGTFTRIKNHFTEGDFANPHASMPRTSFVFSKPLALYVVNNLYDRVRSNEQHDANAYCYVEYNADTYIVALSGDRLSEEYEVVGSLPLNPRVISRMQDVNPAMPSEGYLESVVADDMAQIQAYLDEY